VEAGHALGSHGMQHRSWRGLRRSSLDEELSHSKAVLEAITGRAITRLSCPFGAYDRHMLRRAWALGYEHVFTSDGGPADSHARLQPRTTIRCGGSPSVAEILAPSRAAVLVGCAKRAVKRCR